jgi:hypothetical protein
MFESLAFFSTGDLIGNRLPMTMSFATDVPPAMRLFRNRTLSGEKRVSAVESGQAPNR